MMRRTFKLLTTALALAACDDEAQMPIEPELPASLSHVGGSGEPLTYEVSIANLTDLQPLTPPLAATHRPAARLFRVGHAASMQLQQIAENGNLAPMLALLGGSSHVHDIVVSEGDPVPPLLPGEERSFTIEATANARWISFAAMLICTNDGFTGLDAFRLPRSVGESVTVHTDAYDAGTEVNTEDVDDIVPPCGPLTGVHDGTLGTGMSDPALVENGKINHHEGIDADADLLETHDWTDPVARVEITRIS